MWPSLSPVRICRPLRCWWLKIVRNVHKVEYEKESDYIVNFRLGKFNFKVSISIWLQNSLHFQLVSQTQWPSSVIGPYFFIQYYFTSLDIHYNLFSIVITCSLVLVIKSYRDVFHVLVVFPHHTSPHATDVLRMEEVRKRFSKFKRFIYVKTLEFSKKGTPKTLVKGTKYFSTDYKELIFLRQDTLFIFFIPFLSLCKQVLSF